MRFQHYISFFATREIQEGRRRITPKKFHSAVVSSLINMGGLTYPNMQSKMMWSNPEFDQQVFIFSFDRQEPFGELRIEPDASYSSTRTPIDDEVGPTLFLQSLTYELVANMEFFNRFIKQVGRPGTFGIGVEFGGYQNAQVDWEGFSERPGVLPLTNWRLDVGLRASFEDEGLSFPISDSSSKEALEQALSSIIGDISMRVKGVRRLPSGRQESPLQLTDESIARVISDAQSALA